MVQKSLEWKCIYLYVNSISIYWAPDGGRHYAGAVDRRENVCFCPFGAHNPTMDEYVDTTWYALSYMQNALSNSIS